MSAARVATAADGGATQRFVAADPYPWPYDGDLRPDNTALDHHRHADRFLRRRRLRRRAWATTSSLTRAPIEPIRRVLAAMRAGGYTIIHTREGHRPDLADLPANKRWRSRRIGAGIGDPGPAARSWCAASPAGRSSPNSRRSPARSSIDKPGKGSFCATDLELILRTRGIRNLVLTGITTDVCVHTTMREANDRGFECVHAGGLLRRHRPGNHRAAIEMVTMQGGVFGAVATSGAMLEGLAG